MSWSVSWSVIEPFLHFVSPITCRNFHWKFSKETLSSRYSFLTWTCTSELNTFSYFNDFFVHVFKPTRNWHCLCWLRKWYANYGNYMITLIFCIFWCYLHCFQYLIYIIQNNFSLFLSSMCINSTMVHSSIKSFKAVAFLDKTLCDDYLCLMASNQQRN